MERFETARLLEVIASVDYREVNPLVVQAWHEVVGRLDYDTALAAVSAARADTGVEWLAPKHIIQYADIIRRRRERAERVANPAIPEGGGAPKPKNFDAMAAAYNNPVEWARQVAIYEQQLRDAGYTDEWTETGRVDSHKPRFGYNE